MSGKKLSEVLRENMPPPKRDETTKVVQNIDVLFILGSPGTGKTFYAKRLGWMVLDKDALYYPIAGTFLERVLKAFNINKRLRDVSYASYFSVLENIGGLEETGLSRPISAQGNFFSSGVLPQIIKYLENPERYPFRSIKFLRLVSDPNVSWQNIRERRDPKTGKQYFQDTTERATWDQFIRERNERMRIDDEGIELLSARFGSKFQYLTIDTSDHRPMSVQAFIAQIQTFMRQPRTLAFRASPPGPVAIGAALEARRADVMPSLTLGPAAASSEVFVTVDLSGDSESDYPESASSGSDQLSTPPLRPFGSSKASPQPSGTSSPPRGPAYALHLSRHPADSPPRSDVSGSSTSSRAGSTDTPARVPTPLSSSVKSLLRFGALS